MIDQIITAMAVKIHELFPDANIYTETVEQGLEEPAFYIHNINVDHQDQIAGRFIHSMPFEVVYFTKGGASDRNNTTLQTLLVSMRLVTMTSGKKIRGTRLSGQVIDGELHFFVNYDLMLALEVDPPDLMNELNIEGGTNG